MHANHERLSAAEFVLVHQLLCVMNDIRAFDATNPAHVVKFRGVHVARLLTDIELEALRQHFLVSGTTMVGLP